MLYSFRNLQENGFLGKMRVTGLERTDGCRIDGSSLMGAEIFSVWIVHSTRLCTTHCS